MKKNGQLIEVGSAGGKTGSATIYAAEDGGMLQSLGGDGRVDGEHARFAAPARYLRLECEQRRGDGEVAIYLVTPEGETRIPTPPPSGDTSPIGQAADAAWKKASCYHCREAHYALPRRAGR